MAAEDILQREHDTLNGAIEDLAERMREDIEDVFNRYKERNNEALLTLFLGLALAADTANNVRKELTKILTEVGYNRLIRQQLRSYPELSRASLDYFNRVVVPGTRSLTKKNVDVLAALVELREQTFRGLVYQRAVEPYVQSVVGSLAINAPKEQMLGSIQAVGDGLNMLPIVTHSSESMDVYVRALQTLKADELGLSIYAYRGPLDAVTSPQCVTMLQINRYGAQGVLPAKDITNLLHPNLYRNRYSPLLIGGHVNCRHIWLPITAERARELGYRGPGVKDAD